MKIHNTYNKNTYNASNTYNENKSIRFKTHM